MEHDNSQLVDEPLIIANIKTRYECVTNVSCVSGDEVWTCGWDNIIRLYNLQGVLMKSIQTKSGNWPEDITMTRVGELVYIDSKDRSVNILKNSLIETLVKRWARHPTSVCCTSSDDLLVVLTRIDFRQTKVVRYSGSTEKQSIQFDDIGRPLYSPCPCIRNISENTNLDICVSEYDTSTAVVVNQAGKRRFTYTGPPSMFRVPFYPLGIANDSQSRILIADMRNNRIHILDQDGYILRYIRNRFLRAPWDVCVDAMDNLFVAETDKVKKIQYSST